MKERLGIDYTVIVGQQLFCYPEVGHEKIHHLVISMLRADCAKHVICVGSTSTLSKRYGTTRLECVETIITSIRGIIALDYVAF